MNKNRLRKFVVSLTGTILNKFAVIKVNMKIKIDIKISNNGQIILFFLEKLYIFKLALQIEIIFSMSI